MKRIMLASLAFCCATSATAAERRFTVTNFDRIQVDGPYQVTLATGRGASAQASGSAEALDRVSIEVQGRTLRIRPNRSAWGNSLSKGGSGAVAIQLATHELRAASVSGSGGIKIDKARAMRFDVAVSGNGRIAIGSIEADNLTLGLLGSGSIAVGGKAKTLRATIQGTGNLEANTLTVEDADLSAASAGTIALNVRRAAKINATGAGDVEILGTPACTVQHSGSGQVICGK